MDLQETDLNDRKRKRSSLDEDDERPRKFAIVPPGLTYPRSIYKDYSRDSPVCSEAKALEVLLDEVDLLQLEDEYALITLNDFEIYRSDRTLHPSMLTSLNDLKTRGGVSDLLFDGVLCFQGRECRVEGVPFEILSIDGYHDFEEASVADRVCIRSPLAEKRLAWYELGQPSAQYYRFHEPFLWLVDFVRYFVNFLDASEIVQLSDFRSRFHTWLVSLYGNSTVFKRWLNRCGRTDFCVDITAHYEFLWKEAIDIDEKNRRHKIWKEVDPKCLGAVEKEHNEEQNTIATPYVFRCFRNMYFGKYLESRAPEPSVKQKCLKRMSEMGFAERPEDADPSYLEPSYPEALDDVNFSYAHLAVDKVEVGDIVGIPRDTETRWKDVSEIWYAYVQGITFDKYKRKLLKVIWLYRPSDTTCSYMMYPYQNELFFSDNCNCRDGRLYATDVKFKLRARLFPKTLTRSKDVFIRQTYLTDEASFVTFRPEHCKCTHLTHIEQKTDLERVQRDYVPGDTVLVDVPGHEFLEPCRIIQVGAKLVTVERFLRRQRDMNDCAAKPNEIIHTSKVEAYSAKRIIRRCYVRIASVERARSKNAPPPAPYCYDGAADCWLLTGALDPDDGNIRPVSGISLQSLIEGFDPEESSMSREPLPGLSLFSGGGSFDRGLQEANMVKFKTAVDWDSHAIHTYSANLRLPEETSLFHGSVNDHLAKLLSGSQAGNVPQVGTVLFICGGSPCQGVSGLQLDKGSSASLRNTSLVTSIVSYVDLYRPKYALFENVFGLTRKVSKEKDENVLSQIICALVGMGYQVQTFNIDAWSCGPSQSRSRLFIAIAAPGLTPLVVPHQTHSHPPATKDRSLGTTANRLSFGNRRFEKTPFSFTSAQEATKDISWIGDAAVAVNPAFPDHRVTAHKVGIRSEIPRSLSRFPYGCGWKEAVESGRMPPVLVEDLCTNRGNNTIFMGSDNKAWTRVNPKYVFSTVTTNVRPDDVRGGQWVHWEQNRLISLLEARRAQGIPDHEVLVGVPSRQWKIAGNGVARQVAVAFGMSLREACLSNNKIPYRPPPEIVTSRTASYISNGATPQSVDIASGSKLSWRRFSQGLQISQPSPQPIPDSDGSMSTDEGEYKRQGLNKDLRRALHTSSGSAEETPPTSQSRGSSNDELSKPIGILSKALELSSKDSSSEDELDPTTAGGPFPKYFSPLQPTTALPGQIAKANIDKHDESESADSDLIFVEHIRRPQSRDTPKAKSPTRVPMAEKRLRATNEDTRSVGKAKSGSFFGWFKARPR